MILTTHLKPLLHSTEHKKPDLMQIISWIKVYNGKHYFEGKKMYWEKNGMEYGSDVEFSICNCWYFNFYNRNKSLYIY